MAPAAHEWVALFVAVFHHAQRGRHAVLHQHGFGDLRGHFNVGAGPGGGLAKHQLLGGPATHGKHQPGIELIPVIHALVVFLGGHGMPTGAATSQNGDLVHTFDVLEGPSSQGVATLMVCGDFLFFLRNHLRRTARSTDHSVGGLL